MRRPADEAARALVTERFPDAVQAWLAGSVVTGGATETSDLDITVLLEEARVRRESLAYAGWPVELFVHTEASVRHFVDKDLGLRRPTMARLVAHGVPLLEPSRGGEVREYCERVLAEGPGRVGDEELELARYALTDLLDDLASTHHDAEATAVSLAVWRHTAELALAADGWWSGSGKWLVRELAALDEHRGTRLADELDLALRRALAGERSSLATVADAVLDGVGGRLWEGFHRDADLSGSSP